MCGYHVWFTVWLSCVVYHVWFTVWFTGLKTSLRVIESFACAHKLGRALVRKQGHTGHTPHHCERTKDAFNEVNEVTKVVTQVCV